MAYIDKTNALVVSGIAEMRNGFRAMENGMDREFSRALKSVADVVARNIQQRMPFSSKPQASSKALWPKTDPGAAARSVKPKAMKFGASVSEGGLSAPYVPWLDFGGTTGRGHRPGQRYSGSIVREWQGKNVQIPAGRYMYPAITEERPHIEQKLMDAVKTLGASAGFEVQG